MKWPRGKYNGKRIVGFALKIKMNVCEWVLYWPAPHGGSLGIGPFRIWLEANYESDF